MRWLALLVLPIVAIAVGGTLYWRANGAGETPSYRLAKVERGPLRMAVSSTGKVNPVVTVQVGTQVSGQISELLVDYNSAVSQGQVIARIDPSPFAARVRAARADFAFARANVAMQQASLTEQAAEIAGAEAALKDASQSLARSRALLDRRVASESTVDKAVATRDQAKARLDGLRAQLTRLRAQVEAAQAQALSQEAVLHDREFDLEHTFIRSPVDGVVIGRDVDLGQTVAASLQAPVLFTIAQDLLRMQVEVSVDEADIGRVREGQEIRFTVDAFPGRSFVGEVTQIRKQPKEVSNVVTYTVIATAENPDLALLPGMTANVEIVVGERKQALKVPDAALRFRPPGAAPPVMAADGEGGVEAARQRAAERLRRLSERLALTPLQQEQVAAIFHETGQAIRGLRQGEGGGETGEAEQQLRSQSARRVATLLDDGQRRKFELMQAEQAAGARRRGQVWTLDGKGVAVPRDVVVGISDGSMSELLGGELQPGTQVIVGIASVAARQGGTTP
jgi:HlyD family secretion protein